MPKRLVIVLVLLLQLCQSQISASFKLDTLQLRTLNDHESDGASLQASGILEFELDGKWYQFCDSEWGRTESYVACGQLGFSDTFGKSIPIEREVVYQRNQGFGTKSVNCEGSESQLSQCKYQRITSSAICESAFPVVLNCTTSVKKNAPPKSTDINNKIRLRGATLPGEGRVEVLRNGRWKGICSNSWDINSANVACRQLGFGTAKNFYADARFGRGQHLNRLALVDLKCQGSEKSLDKCPHVEKQDVDLFEAECSQIKWMSVACFVPNQHFREKIDLLDGASEVSGRVVVQLGKMITWSSICSDHWSMKEATVVCRQMGLGFALEALQDNRYSSQSKRYLSMGVMEVQCHGHEESLEDCRYKLAEGTASRCKNKNHYAGVVCTQKLPDLQLDIEALENSFVLDAMPLHQLDCAASQGCLAPTSLDMNKNSSLQLLRFTISAWNRGTTDYRPKLDPQDWIWHLCHQHYHSVENFAHYNLLWTDTLQSAAYGQKASFCLEDVKCEDSQSRQYRCEQVATHLQGLSVGCSDIYYANYDCQWIDITDVKPGRYYFQVSLNPLETVAETDFLNNLVICELIYTGTSVLTRNCHATDDYAASIL